MKIAVVGGGVIGLSLAESLERLGAEVSVVEAAAFGGGASAGNAGWVTPSLAVPLPAPGTVAQGLRWMFDSGGPLVVRPVLRFDYARWLFDFWRSTQPRRFGAGLAAMVPLADRVREDYEALSRRCAFELHSDGLLYVAHGEDALAEELEVLARQRRFGYRGELVEMDRAQALQHEPALGDTVAGAILAVEDQCVRPEAVVAALLSRLREREVELRERSPVSRLTAVRGGWRLECDEDAIEAERVLVCAGVATANLLRPLGARLPLQGAKGYSITFERPPLSPRQPLYLLEAKVAVSPFDAALRLTGTFELGASGLDLDRARIDAIEEAGERSLRDGWRGKGARRWAGYRSLLPDGLPALGPVPGAAGLFVATGHSTLGVTLAPTTAELLAPVVLGERPSLSLAPFSPGRFDR